MIRLFRSLLLCLMPCLLLAACGGSLKKEVALPTVFVPPTLSVFLPTWTPSAIPTSTATMTPFPSRTPYPPTWTPVPSRTLPPLASTLERHRVPTNTPFEIPTFDPSIPHPAAPADPVIVVPSDPVVVPVGGSSGTSWPVVVYDSTFVVEVLGSTTPVLVEYWATWCGYCKEMSPLIDQVASEYSGRMKVAKLDIDANPSMTQFYGVEAVPTFHIFSNGSIIASQVGSMSEDDLRAWINESLG